LEAFFILVSQQTFLHEELQTLKRGFVSVHYIGFFWIWLRGDDELGNYASLTNEKER